MADTTPPKSDPSSPDQLEAPPPTGQAVTRRRLLGGAAGLIAAGSLAGTAAAGGAANGGAALRRPGASGVTLRWLGNNSWELRFGGTVVLIDPWLTRFRTGTYSPSGADPETPIASDPATIDRYVTAADLVLVTHGHYDHLPDVPHIAQRTGATVLGTETHLNLLRALGAPDDQLGEVRGGEHIQFDGFSVQVLRSTHSMSGPRRRVTYAGTRPAAPPPRPQVIRELVEGGSLAYMVTVGDTAVLDLGSANYVRRELEGLRPDVLLLQPGGATVVDYVGELMEALGRPPVVVPTHWDDFDFPLDEPARDWGGLEALRTAVRRASPRTDFVVVDHLEELRP
jgi:L-ascorbate metabolism protein UlaG (beta-lactamase superfamily)